MNVKPETWNVELGCESPLIFERSTPGRVGTSLPASDVPATPLPAHLLRDDLPLPEVDQPTIIRHYTRLSQKNWAVDVGFYPLGSCTMKYNPKVNEETCRLPGFAHIHPYQDPATIQGALQLLYELQVYLGEISGLPAVTLQPAAGAQGELTGILMILAYHHDRRDQQRTRILIPDSAHGTNPASSAMGGLQVVVLPSDRRGNVDLGALKALCDERTAGLMLTNPNTLGLFDEHVQEVCRIVHRAGGLVYGDGANLNAITGIVRPGDLGIDVLHINLHKTFSTPHGGGGPGAGPVCVRRNLADFLPTPVVVRKRGKYLWHRPAKTIGQVKSFYGNFGVLVRAYTYIRSMGPDGMRAMAEMAVVNANYILARLRGTYEVPYDRLCKHECVVTSRPLGQYGVRTLDVAKRLLDYGFHAPTIYFPLIVPEALMIEPTETESIETLDCFVDAMLQIAQEAKENPELLHQAPTRTPVGRLDEVTAAREPKLRWTPA